MATEGFGLAITFSSGFFAEITNVDDEGIKRNPLDTTHDGTTVTSGIAYRTFIPSKVADPGQVKVKLWFNPNRAPPFSAAEMVTITLPIPIGGSVAGTISGSGFLIEEGKAMPLDNLMVQDCTIKKSGPWTHTPGS